ncbi:MAG TPA: hypothetical protein PKH29_12265, partial [Oscillospiraceae bacterium]|nr:hypothetical protein [Oscillospiraceae bacterium]HPS49019.1 hypothetical protein [Flexilinea sp.]
EAKEKQTYGETLINLAAAHRYPAGVIATTLCEEKRTLKERLGAIMTYTKKGIWNKILSFVLIGAIAASGILIGACETAKKDYPDAVNIYAPEFFNNIGAPKDDQIKQQWLDMMFEKYGVKLNIISDYKDANNDSSASIDNKVSQSIGSSSKQMIDENGNTNFIGLSSISNIRELKTYIQYETFVPLEDYLDNNPVWNALPDDFKSIFEVDGHIYAIPTSASQILSGRDIKNEALQSTGSTVTDLDSFRNFALAYTQTTGNPAIGGVSLKETNDILNAFGLYPGIYQSTPFSYDPKEDCIVDFMTKDTAVDALEYLRELYKTGSIRLSFDIGYSNYDLVASGYSQYHNYSDSYFSYILKNENCTTLFNLNPAYPQIASTMASGFAMTQNTPQPQETIDFFIDMLFGSQQSYLDCWLGSSDNYTLNKDGTIIIKTTQDTKGNDVYPSMPNLTGGLPELFPYSNANIYYSQNGVVTMDRNTDVGKYNAYMKLQYDAINNKSVIEIPLLYQNIIWSTYDITTNSAYRKHTNFFQDAIISKDKTVQQVVDEYKKAMFELGGNTILDEMNAAIGKKTAYYYG